MTQKNSHRRFRQEVDTQRKGSWAETEKIRKAHLTLIPDEIEQAAILMEKHGQREAARLLRTLIRQQFVIRGYTPWKPLGSIYPPDLCRFIHDWVFLLGLHRSPHTERHFNTKSSATILLEGAHAAAIKEWSLDDSGGRVRLSTKDA